MRHAGRFAPRLRIRTRLALWCALLVMASGVAVLIGTLIAVQHTLDAHAPKPLLKGYSTDPVELRSEQFAAVETNRILVQETTSHVRDMAFLGLAVLAVLALAIGWLVAGRMLRPATELVRTTREISASSLDRRVRASGPDDELKALADSFDDMLDRLDRSFERQKRFVADVSHELRTPLTAMRAQIDVALDRHHRDDELRDALREVGGVVDRATLMINAMLSLSRADILASREQIDLSAAVGEIITARVGIGGLQLHTALPPAQVVGDPVLVNQLLENLIGNAVAYNKPGGVLAVTVDLHAETVVLVVGNDGPKVRDGDVVLLLDRFRRGDQAEASPGFGLGLSIVAAIASAHDAQLDITARPGGGLDVAVTFHRYLEDEESG
ncbi:MAG: Histidine kinase [Pseudonocardiales bacterium]|nr:Histidine kinase [Pseudonocardiales bacterium]